MDAQDPARAAPDAAAPIARHTPMVSAWSDDQYSFGAIMLDDGTCRFRLWAPAADRVALEIDGQPPAIMTPSSNGFHELKVACDAGSHYRYRLRADLAVPDPASRLQDGDVHAASVVLGRDSHAWRNGDWRGRPWTDTVLYEIHPGLAGGFAGIEQRLAGLAELGITAVELMPIADFAGKRNWGYDGVLPYAPDCSYGTPEELKNLIDSAHGLGIMVFLDVVYNHFGPDGNYLGEYAPDFFRTDQKTPWGPAIDFRQPPVRAFFAENALYWLTEYRFDGLRLDAVHAISQADWLPEMAHFVRKHVDPARHVHLVVENDDNLARYMRNGFDAQWNDDGHHVVHYLLTGETQGYYAAYADHPAEKLARCLAEGFVYQGDRSIWRHGAPRGEPSRDLPPTAFIFFLQNHDQTGNRALGERLTTLAGKESKALYAAVALQLLTPQVPLLFMGEECGATVPFLYFTGYEDQKLAQAIRDGRRKEFARFDAFSDPRAQSLIPDPNDPDTYAASMQPANDGDHLSAQWRAYYRELLATRHRYITPQLAGARSVEAYVLGPAAVMAQWRLANGSLLTIYTNLGKHEAVSARCQQMYEADSRLLFESTPGASRMLTDGALPAACTIATLGPPRVEVHL